MELEQKRAFIIRAVYVAIWALIAAIVIKYGFGLLTPFVLGFLIAYVLRRPTAFLSDRMQLPYRLVALMVVLIFYCTVGLFLTLLAIRAFWAVYGLFELLPHLYNDHFLPALTNWFTDVEGLAYYIDDSFLDFLQEFEGQILSWLGTVISKASTWAVAIASGVATAIPSLFIKLVLMLISSFFIAMDYETLTGFCMRQLGEKSGKLFMEIKTYVVGTLFVCIGSYCIIVCITFTELSVGLKLLGLQHPFLVAFCIAIFDILPVLGTGGIMIPWGLITLLRGDVKLGLGLLAIYVVITIVRNIVEPKIVGSQLGLHPVATLSSMFLGGQLFGVVGLFGFPILLSLLRYLDDIGSIHILKHEPPKSETPKEERQ